MTGRDFVEVLMDRVADWPEDAKVELVQSIVQIEERLLGTYHLSDEERANVRRGFEEMRQRTFASEADIKALFDRYRG